MKKLKKFFSVMINELFEAVILGSFISVILFYVIMLIYIFTGNEPASSAAIAATMLLINITSISGAISYIHRKPPHKYDSEIIGRNFTGYSKKSKLFEKALDAFVNNRIPDALSGFKKVEENYSESMNQEEKGILFFYIARCYNYMQYTPNALRYYRMSAEAGFKQDFLTFFHARCLGENGDIDEAVEMYTVILNDENNRYRFFARTDMGRMFLKHNDIETALKWFTESADCHEDYANALGGAAVAYTTLHQFDKGEELYRMALLNNITDPDGFTSYYKRVQAAALTETHTDEAIKKFEREMAEPQNTASANEEKGED